MGRYVERSCQNDKQGNDYELLKKVKIYLKQYACNIYLSGFQEGNKKSNIEMVFCYS